MDYADYAIAMAAQRGDTEGVATRIAGGVDIHTALQRASSNGHAAIVRLLIAAGANIHARNEYAIRWAAMRGHMDVVAVLLAAGADHRDVLRLALKHGGSS